MKGEIEKARDQLGGLKEYQDFMLELSGAEFKKEMDMNKIKKIEKVKRDWIN